MYARGELYPQAIAEARAALTEDPRRIDLEIILARSYYLPGKWLKATEICSRLINRLPFCYEANHILGDILPKTSRGEDAKVYQQNVKALDPYAAFLSPNTPTIDQIPENAVHPGTSGMARVNRDQPTAGLGKIRGRSGAGTRANLT